ESTLLADLYQVGTCYHTLLLLFPSPCSSTSMSSKSLRRASPVNHDKA
ncbi:hypothetical protein A2U01_0065965, partial [Trifolium medium]|nr:hypothetical protein [Trifolium medium]